MGILIELQTPSSRSESYPHNEHLNGTPQGAQSSGLSEMSFSACSPSSSSTSSTQVIPPAPSSGCSSHSDPWAASYRTHPSWTPGPPPSSMISEEAAPLCARCQLQIVDKFYLSAVAQKWHTACLKCSECGVELENQISCFEKEGQIFCKEDYLRIYANNRQCYRCLSEIQSSDLVIKARHCLFHVDCFRCATCDLLLRKGDLFGMFEDILYCKQHYEHLTHAYGPPVAPAPPPEGLIGPPGSSTPPPPGTLFDRYQPDWGGSYGGPEWYSPQSLSSHPGSSDFGGSVSEFGFENNNEPCLKKRRGRKKRKMDAFNAYLDVTGGSPGSSILGGGSGFHPPSSSSSDALTHAQSKTKRARTSFKHHQLRIMRGHFQVNQNPDSRELKMLSQKTGLDKKVLQVWFQNARAKWRRVNTQTGMGVGGVCGNAVGADGSMLLDNLGEETGDSDSAGMPQ